MKELVQKYDAIRQDYGRRLMFALKESSGLADLRRQIELHEQTLQMWFTTVIASSLRRILSRIDDLLKVYERMREIKPRRIEKIREQVKRQTYSTTASRSQVIFRCAEETSHRAKLGSIPNKVTMADAEPLKKELLESGLSEAQIDANLDAAIKYLFADEYEQDQMEEEVRQRASTMRGQTTRYEDRRPTNSSNRSRPFYHNKETLHLHNIPHEETIEIPEVLHRSRSSGQPRRVNVERPPPGYLDVPEPSTRYRYSSPSRHYARSESPSLDSEMVQVRCPRIERSQSPSPGVTHYFIRE